MPANPSKKFSIWKILGIIILVLVVGFAILVFTGTDDYNKEGDDVSTKTTEILSQLKNNQVDEVYKNAHPEFTKATSKEDLSTLIKSIPILTTFSNSKFIKISHGNGEAEIKGELLDKNDKANSFTLSLKKDGEIWKFYALDVNIKNIAPIQADSPEASAGKEDKTAKITEVNVGQSYDKDETVKSEISIPSNAPAIYVSVSATQSVDKIAATVAFLHVETGDTFNSTQLLYRDKNGFFIHPIFKFTKPTNGWPKGTIKVIATLANGDTKETSFEAK